MRRRLAFAVWLTVALAAGVPAQEQRGSIEGVVRDSQGGAVPGVAVLARSSTGLSLEIVSDGTGAFRFASLPPNQYELTAKLDGFVPARVVDIELALGVQLQIDLVLAPAGLDVTVEVTSRSPLVAITQSSRATSIRSDQIEKMPHGRDFTSLALQAPGATEGRKLGGISIDGSTGAENRIVIDGVETTDTWIGTPGQFLTTDFVSELQVKSSGYSAEYGGSTGGVLNAITKTGSNSWHGDALFYWSGDALDAGPRPTLQLAPAETNRAEYVTFPKDRYRQVEPGLTMGGPLVRDRLWFFGGYIPSFRPLDRTVTFRADGTTRTFRQDLSRHNLTANITTQLGAGWRARAAVNTGSQSSRGLLPALDGTSNPAANYAIDELTPNYSASVGVDLVPNHWLFTSARAGYFFRNFYNEGVYRGDRIIYQSSSLGLAGVPAEYQHPRGFANVPTNIGRDRGKGPHFSAQIDSTLFVSALGQHQMKGGVQLDRVGLDALAGGTGNGINIYWDQSFMGMRGPLGYYRIQTNDRLPNLGFITQGTATVNNVGLFFQDAWTIGRRVTVNAGLRTESESVPSLSPDPQIPKTAIRFGFGDKLAPRLGIAWDATGDGKTKAYGSWGVFYDITKLQMSFAFGGFSSANYTYTLDGGDLGAIVDNSNCPPACPGRLMDAPRGGGRPLNDPDDSHIDPDLRQTQLQEAVVGVEREIAPSLSVSARYVHKQIGRAVEDLGIRGPGRTDTRIVISNPGYGLATVFYPERGTTPIPFPKAKRRYDAVEVGIDRRLSKGWSARASYTWSRLFGNYSGLVQSDEDGRVAPNSGRVFDYPVAAFDERGQPVSGVLATDRPHQFNLNVLFDSNFGTSVGARWFGASGIPRTREAAFIPGIGVAVMYRGRNSDGRLPFLSQVDLYVQHELVSARRFQLTISANVLNLLNQSTATNYFPTELFTGQAISIDESAFYSGVETQALIAEQRLVRDARFLMDSDYQSPRSVRLGIKLGF